MQFVDDLFLCVVFVVLSSCCIICLSWKLFPNAYVFFIRCVFRPSTRKHASLYINLYLIGQNLFSLLRFAVKKSTQVISSFPDGDPFENIDGDKFQRVWSNSSFLLKLSEGFTKAVVLVKNEVFNSGFDVDDMMNTIPKTVEIHKGVHTCKNYELIFCITI